ncbi:MAG: c-type cytochrome [Nitrospinota bacterium]|nr:c-type cytochrome [Nitrospinota bacterium]
MTNKTENDSRESKLPVISAFLIFLILGIVAFIKSAKEPELQLPLGLEIEKYIVPPDNPMTLEKVKLGYLLFFDERLSGDGTVACATCHNPDNAFTDGAAVSTGIGGEQGNRSAPTVINRVFSTLQFWDGRAGSLEEQAKGPLTNPIEHGLKNADEAVARIASIEGYREMFRKVFDRDVNMDDLARAIAAFERTVLSGNSRYDQYAPGNEKVLSDSEERGMRLFTGKGMCAICHSGPNFTDEKFHNIGVGMADSNPDLGRYLVTGVEKDKGAFKTPTLREITKTAPYMHDGSVETLQEVMEFYNKGGEGNPYLSEKIFPLNLSKNEIADLTAFMSTLEGIGWQGIKPPENFPR